MTGQIERAVHRFRKADEADDTTLVASRISAAAFRASVEERLTGLERDVGELRGRITGLIFVVIGAVITQVVLKLAQ
ncbi:MAG: hypothetical protein IH957_04230 [Chloroflexi bacterium]|nr:hypothetical protein [Chloroflexota bacterium]